MDETLAKILTYLFQLQVMVQQKDQRIAELETMLKDKASKEG